MRARAHFVVLEWRKVSKEMRSLRRISEGGGCERAWYEIEEREANASEQVSEATDRDTITVYTMLDFKGFGGT